MADSIQPTHLQRHAVIYVRQSSPNQVNNHQESTRLQYALKRRALEYGWTNGGGGISSGEAELDQPIPDPHPFYGPGLRDWDP